MMKGLRADGGGRVGRLLLVVVVGLPSDAAAVHSGSWYWYWYWW